MFLVSRTTSKYTWNTLFIFFVPLSAKESSQLVENIAFSGHVCTWLMFYFLDCLVQNLRFVNVQSRKRNFSECIKIVRNVSKNHFSCTVWENVELLQLLYSKPFGLSKEEYTIAKSICWRNRKCRDLKERKRVGSNIRKGCRTKHWAK